MRCKLLRVCVRVCARARGSCVYVRAGMRVSAFPRMQMCGCMGMSAYVFDMQNECVGV